MAIAHSKVTAQVRRKRATRFSSVAVHRALFGDRPPKPRTLEELKAGVRRHIKKRRARR